MLTKNAINYLTYSLVNKKSIDLIKSLAIDRLTGTIQFRRRDNATLFDRLTTHVTDNAVISSNTKSRVRRKLLVNDEKMIEVVGGDHICKCGNVYVYCQFSKEVMPDGMIDRHIKVTYLKRHIDEINALINSLYPNEERLPIIWGNLSQRAKERIGVIPEFYGKQEQLIDPQLYNELDLLMDRFVNNKEYYTSLELPYKETVLLYGPPGTGKTSLYRHFASKYGLDMMQISPAELAGALRHCKGKTLIVMDDINSDPELCKPIEMDESPLTRRISGAMRSSGLSDRHSYANFLNLLDGANPLNDVFVVMSTNDLEVLQEALYRKGRVNRLIHLDYLDVSTVNYFLRQSEEITNYVNANIAKGDIVVGMIPTLKRAESLDAFKAILAEGNNIVNFDKESTND